MKPEPKGHKTLGDRGYTIADEILTAIEDGHSLQAIERKINLYLFAYGVPTGIGDFEITLKKGV